VKKVSSCVGGYLKKLFQFSLIRVKFNLLVLCEFYTKSNSEYWLQLYQGKTQSDAKVFRLFIKSLIRVCENPEL